MKKWMVVPSSMIALVLFCGAAYSANAVKLVVNGNSIATEVPPQIIEGNTMVPIRAVAEATGADVKWNEKEQMVTVDYADRASLLSQIDLLRSAIIPSSADKAVEAWAEAVKNRNGAVQYALLSSDIQTQTLKSYEEMHWVTGLSSPWVDSFKVTGGVEDGNGAAASYDIVFQLKTSTGSAGEGSVKVTLGMKDGKWLITGLQSGSGSENLGGIVVLP
ncbi:copper amine oxidase N-terminal domain-containing protein [Paenibacillus allorhizosphaerae]|uniref:Copper amine oxidase-like N-terminal domain-containing protein n=1 Tax=Paenibacillus allorhizosphaerae TaxID=2849866 RepID=A0ABM8VLJ7_9BACL|nr:copper amine oxidase N-terminal domain-containing protein [Paenibacillus allorhizosphaerae]CAG7648574.1 hypothetical protein PAECIP111802_04252 [Paenibacillus allorhizosphaerae]